MTASKTEPYTLQALLDIMARLREPEHGCPWDREQNFQTIAPYTLEEVYEVVDAIERGDPRDLQDELGDLLFQVVFHAQLAGEVGWFDFSAIVEGVCQKMIRRHPHVFADEEIGDAKAQTLAWERHKQNERAHQPGSALDGVPLAMPALTRAVKLQKKAARAGLDWPDTTGVFDKLQEEIIELREEIRQNVDREAVKNEVGDLLFSAVNLARHAGIDPETALRHANRKFSKRFRQVEAHCRADGVDIGDTDPDTLDRIWEEVKQQEN
jgi:MazG family protein